MMPPYDDDEVAAARAAGNQAVDTIATRLDELAAMFDDREMVEGASALGAAVHAMRLDPGVLSNALAVMALRHRRAMAAAVEMRAAPVRRLPSVWWTAGVAAVGSAVGAITVLWLGGAFG